MSLGVKGHTATEKPIVSASTTEQLRSEDLRPTERMLKDLENGIGGLLGQQKFFESRKSAQNEGSIPSISMMG